MTGLTVVFQMKWPGHLGICPDGNMAFRPSRTSICPVYNITYIGIITGPFSDGIRFAVRGSGPYHRMVRWNQAERCVWNGMRSDERNRPSMIL